MEIFHADDVEFTIMVLDLSSRARPIRKANYFFETPTSRRGPMAAAEPYISLGGEVDHRQLHVFIPRADIREGVTLASELRVHKTAMLVEEHSQAQIAVGFARVMPLFQLKGNALVDLPAQKIECRLAGSGGSACVTGYWQRLGRGSVMDAEVTFVLPDMPDTGVVDSLASGDPIVVSLVG